MKKKFIISGPPGSGKTTLINALSAKGIPCIHEVARDIITAEQETNGKGTPWEDVARFSELVFKETLNRFELQKNSLFCDRSLVDNMAYLTYYKAKISTELKTFDFENVYHNTIFFTRPWEAIFINDAQRPQSFSESVELSKQLVETYTALGYHIEFIPFTTVARRIDFILDKIVKSFVCYL